MPDLDLAQRIRDRLDGLGAACGLVIEFPAKWTKADSAVFAAAYLEALRGPSEVRVLPSGPKVYPGFEVMRDALLAVVDFTAPGEPFPHDGRDLGERMADEAVDAAFAHVREIIAAKLGVEPADA